MPSLDLVGSAIGKGIGNFGSQFMYWMGNIIIGLIIIGALWFFYLFFQYKYKSEIYIPRGMGYVIKDNIFTRIREIKKNGVRKWKFFLKRKTMQPLEDKYILPGNKIKLLKMGDSFFPGKINVGNPEMNIGFVNQPTKFWMMNEIQQTAQEYQDLKSKLMPMMLTMGTILFCLIFAGVTIYFIVQAGQGQTQQVVSAIQGIDLQQVATSFKP